MITVSGRATVQRTIRQMTTLAASMASAPEDATGLVIAELLASMPPATPVRTGNMQRGYSSLFFGTTGQLLNEMFYSGWVARTGTRKMRPNAVLRQMLTTAEDTAGGVLADLVNRRIAEAMR